MRGLGLMSSEFGPLPSALRPWQPVQRCRKISSPWVTEAVVGNPLYMSGDQSPQAAKAQAFAEELRTEFGITVYLWDERLTTTQAHRHLDDAGHAATGRKGIIDQVAAVLILQSFLEARASQRDRS